MDANVKKTALRMIPYGLYVLTARGKDDTVAAATVNWVTQASFEPPLVVVGVKTDSHTHAIIKDTFGNMVASTSYDALRRRDASKRPFVLSRSGWPGIQRYAMGWSGDNLSSFDNLRYNIRLGLGVMISGQPQFGHDIGGFAGDTSGELLARWMEFGVLNPFCRNHTLNGTATAVSRTLIAIMENHQRVDGGVQLPTALWPYLPEGIRSLEPRASA